MALLASMTWKMRMRCVGKDSLFKPPFGFFLRLVGGIPVVRGSRSGAVEALADLIRSQERFVLCIAPEGTRSKVESWKSGFYQIALAAVSYPWSVTNSRAFGALARTENVRWDWHLTCCGGRKPA